MRVLLDTHIALWALADDPCLPAPAKQIICDEGNIIFISAVSVWEIAIKHAIRPQSMRVNAQKFTKLCEKAGYVQLDMKAPHAICLETLKRQPDAPAHNDPFDRMLIAQSKAESMMLLTHDSKLTQYSEPTVLYI
jgi:PIN domain nuclease of toxin-antitoxin system